MTVSSSDGGGGENLVGSSENNGSTWTAKVTDNSGSDPDGSWDVDGGSCTDNVCTLSGIPKRVGSVTFTANLTGTTVTVTKP